MADSDTILLHLDPVDRIVAVSPTWDEFAESNAGTDAVIDRIRGQSLFRYIRGEPTRMLIRILLERAKLGRDPVVRSYRCDSPTLRRYMTMSVQSSDDGGAIFEHRIVRTEPRQKRTEVVFDLRSSTRCCSMCRQVFLDDDWLDEEDAMDAGGLPTPGRVRYGLCPRCEQELGGAAPSQTGDTLPGW